MSVSPSSSATPDIRLALPADLPALVELMREFYAESSYELDTPWATASLSAVLRDSSLGRIWVAVDGDQLVGHTVLTHRYAMEHGGTLGYLDDLFVLPSHRRKGVARALLAALVPACASYRCVALCVEASPDNGPAVALYRALGLTQVQDGRALFKGALASDVG